MSHQEIMLKCAEVNRDYMRLPAGRVDGLQHLTALYQRIAEQSCDCARAWLEGRACPAHEPATEAFWWGVTGWADALGLSIIAAKDQEEWGSVFVAPHFEFAKFVRPLDGTQVLWDRYYGKAPEPLPIVSGPPADVILRLDALWMERVIKLTSKWGLFQHLKDTPALTEAQRLGTHLREPDSAEYQAYLASDLVFFKKLFVNFSFSQGVREQLANFIEKAGK